MYGQTMIMGTYEGLQKIYKQKAMDKLSSPPQRPFIIARGGYAGMSFAFAIKVVKIMV